MEVPRGRRLSQHTEKCFKIKPRNNGLFMEHTRALISDDGYTSTMGTLDEKYNIALKNPHSLHQSVYRAKKRHREELAAAQANAFIKEKFERHFGVYGALDGVNLDRSIRALFGLLTKFKENDPGFDASISFGDDRTLSFLGMLWSPQKAMLGLFGDLLIVDSVHGFTSFGYHVMNVTLIDSTFHSQIGAIALCMHETTESYVKLFEFIKSKTKFVRPPRALIADSAMPIHNAFDKAFEGSSHVFCTFHLKQHIWQWFARSKERDALIELTYDGLFARNLKDLEITVEHIRELISDVPNRTVAKVERYLSEQAPCTQNRFTGPSTGSGRGEQENGVLRSLGFTGSGEMVLALTNFKIKVMLQFQQYLDRVLEAVPAEWSFFINCR